jgi:hypothetical protein
MKRNSNNPASKTAAGTQKWISVNMLTSHPREVWSVGMYFVSLSGESVTAAHYTP